ncbi:MAG: sodium-dependent transporter [Corynebacterium sp.]|nr:sodium-dependent transporter [Corynebacterium sp.]
MSNQQPALRPRGEWSSQLGFIFAALGSAVGLGNIWRFPGVAYENGGGAFLIPYVVALLTAGIPILFLDYALGHRFRGSAPLALRRAAGGTGEALGWFQVMISVFISLYYTAILAWTSMYFIYSINLTWESAETPTSFFLENYLQVSDTPFTFDFVPHIVIPLIIFWILTLSILAMNVAAGLQRAAIIFLPMLVVSFLALVSGALTMPGAVEGLNTFFTPNFAALSNPSVWISAYGQIFFSLSVAFGIMMTYSSYRRRRSNLTGSGLVVAFGNSAFEILSGIGVFAALGFFAAQQGTTIGELEGLTGVGLAFMTFPAIVSAMPLSPIFGMLFFGSLLLAGITSLMSILEVVIGAVTDKFQVSRPVAVWGVGGVLATLSVMLFGTTSGLLALDTIDFFANNMGIVVSAVLTCALAVWIARRGKELAEHLSVLSTFKVGSTWLFLAGALSPVVIGIMLIRVILTTVNDGYGDYPDWFILVTGWGTIAAMAVGALILTAIPWRYNPALFDVWPPVAHQKPVAGAEQLAAARMDAANNPGDTTMPPMPTTY